MERLGTKPAIAAQAPWWGPYFLYGAPFASGGLGRSDGAHGPDEWCEVDGLRRFMHMAYDTVEEVLAAQLTLTPLMPRAVLDGDEVLLVLDGPDGPAGMESVVRVRA